MNFIGNLMGLRREKTPKLVENIEKTILARVQEVSLPVNLICAFTKKLLKSPSYNKYFISLFFWSFLKGLKQTLMDQDLNHLENVHAVTNEAVILSDECSLHYNKNQININWSEK